MNGRKSPVRAGRKLSPADRQHKIADLVVSQGSATPAEISADFDISLMTAHRDIDELVRLGLVRKFHGGVTALPSSVFDSSIAFRERSALSEKAAIAAYARSFVEPGMAVLLEDSTTTLAVAKQLAEIRPLTVITNFPQVIELLKGVEEHRLIMLGGEYQPGHDAYLGLPCIDAVATVRADVHFSSTSAMTVTHAYHSEPDVVLVKRAMMAASDRRVLLMDRHKLGHTALHVVGPLRDFDDVIVDEGIDGEELQALRDSHPSVHVAPFLK